MHRIKILRIAILKQTEKVFCKLSKSLLLTYCIVNSHKFRGFELKKPKFVPAANPDSEEDEDDDEDESVHKPKLR